ncbi:MULTISPECIES: site-specific integrase [unclassified Erythrobacter]|uniref:site-specific integrase n=1 Tax=unclassified Erythrobacter TaxID=2633097 RepID=UPI00076D07FE|nr:MULTISPECIES: site-specific integrase [unclassified Erythrobacter]KWV92459.1 integrase [Erythrobacter sp. AP23]MBO6766784.1 site-specific integrase [Erythrobacter sp.]
MTSYYLKRILAEELARIVPGDAGKRRTKFDYVLPGFGERIHSSGRKSYVLQRTMGGKQRLITIGDAAILTERIAKDVARRLILRIELGQNPADKKQRGKKTPTYASFLRHYWEVAAPTWKPSTVEIHDIYRRTHLEHAFAGKFIDEIGHADAVRWHATLSRSAGPGAANRALEILKAMFAKAEAWGYLPEHSNPFRGVKRNKGRKIERFLSQAEMARLGAALARHRAAKPNEVAVVSLLALTGCRRGEILNLTWGEVQGRKLKLTDSKTGPRIVWLGQKAREVLDGFPRAKKHERVFRFDMLPISAIEGFWRMLRVEAGIEDVRLHDLRHNYASLAARSSETLPMIGNLLGHRHVRTTARYSHLDDASILTASVVIGAEIERCARR